MTASFSCSSLPDALKRELEMPYMQELAAYLEEERRGYEVFPPEESVFAAFTATRFEDVKVVVLGQDPYHGPGQAHGLAFSVQRGMALPPSLKNIYKELQQDVGVAPPSHGCLLEWSRQGVLLLNTTLTVRRGQPLSHSGRGWERFTDAAVRAFAERENPPIFLLWGKHAQETAQRALSNIAPRNLQLLTAAHPSPFSARNGFFGCRHFSKVNGFLAAKGEKEIDWRLS